MDDETYHYLLYLSSIKPDRGKYEEEALWMLHPYGLFDQEYPLFAAERLVVADVSGVSDENEEYDVLLDNP